MHRPKARAAHRDPAAHGGTPCGPDGSASTGARRGLPLPAPPPSAPPLSRTGLDAPRRRPPREDPLQTCLAARPPCPRPRCLRAGPAPEARERRRCVSVTSPPRPRDGDDSRAGLRADATRLGGVESLVLRSGVSAPHSGGAELEAGECALAPGRARCGGSAPVGQSAGARRKPRPPRPCCRRRRGDRE